MVFGTVLSLTTTLSLSCYYNPQQCPNSTNPSFPPPVIQYGHQNQTLMVNDMAVMPCQASSRVPAAITWLKNGQMLNLSKAGENDGSEGSSRYRQLVTGTLQISDLRKSDNGVYTCRAKNEDGEATWTASLIVEEHTNPNTMFQRMPDAAAFPSSPGKPMVLNISEESVELEWTAPERHGASPIIGYILQYWSPSLGESWLNVLDVVPSIPRFRVKHLRPSLPYAFVVRAENSKGIGPPSAISDLITTKSSASNFEEDRMSHLMDLETARQKLASEQLIKLQEVKAINSTAMLLSWKRQRKEPLVQGFYIKWRGPPLTPDHSWVNVTDPHSESVIINGLRPFHSYEFFVIPYHQSIQGMPSNSLDGTTHEAAPSMPPSDVRLRMLNLTSLRVSWRPPPADAINGILKGFLINIKSNQSEERNITTNERATSVTLYRLIPEASYTIRVSARTNANFGVFFNGDPVVMNEETLRNHLRQASEARNYDVWYKQPWSVLIIGFILWCILLLMIILLWYRCCHRQKHMNSKEREFIKIRDGSVANTVARDAFWANHDQFNSAGGEHPSMGHRTNSGCLVGAGGESIHDGCNYSDYGSGGGCATMPQSMLYNMMHNNSGQPMCTAANCSTLQRRSQSPPHHYHYAQLPDGNGLVQHQQQRFGSSDNNNEGVSTFYNQYYDDPSPYATTTLVMNGTSTGQKPRTHRHHRTQGGGGGTLRSHTQMGSGPALPINPIPREPPRNFLSTQAVAANSSDLGSQSRCSLICCPKDHPQQHASSCGALLELSNSEQQQLEHAAAHHMSSTAGNSTNNYRHQNPLNTNSNYQSKRGSQQHPHHAQCQRTMDNHQRSSSVNVGEGNYAHRLNHIGTPCSGLHMPQRDSPQTDVSYVQSSDGTNGSSKAARAFDGGGGGRNTPAGNILDFVPPPPREMPPSSRNDSEARNSYICNGFQPEDEEFNGNDYDAVAEFFPANGGSGQVNGKPPGSHRIHRKGDRSSLTSGQRSTARRAKHHANRNRVSMIENDERCEQDPLMNYDFEADGELSEEEDWEENKASASYSGEEGLEEEVNNHRESVTHSRRRSCDQAKLNSTYFGVSRNSSNNNNEVENGHLPSQTRPSRQPLMGVSVSTLSHNTSLQFLGFGLQGNRPNCVHEFGHSVIVTL